MLLLLLAQVVATAPSPPPTQRNGETVTSIFSADDYPAEALKRHKQGTVQTRLRISKEGTVSSCEVVRAAATKYSTRPHAIS
jgi:outer membrane biosynthesis protein TonB